VNKLRELYDRLKTFLGEVRTEWTKVTFPSRDEVVGTTAVVLVTSVIFAVYLWVVDALIVQAYQQVFKLLG
jgi:preprotein translocase subunit SecE